MTGKEVEVTASIIRFIKRFPVESSHYGRGKCGRQYMNPELNIKKLWRMWKQERKNLALPLASVSKFDKIFRTSFNLSFKKPRVDVCPYCEETQNRINAGVDVPENRALMKLHRARAKRFYKILRESAADSSNLCIAFDMQQNKPLPKTNVGEAYYSRQLWVHNLTFVVHNQARKQRKRNVHIYKWLESESGKGSNEIVSALSHLFKNVIEKRIATRRYKRIRFFCDSCPGQNKNSPMLVFLMQMMAKKEVKRYVREIEVIFPIRGHSYLPPDRVFGRIEKEQRKLSVVTTPAEYQTIDERYGTVYTYDDDWRVYDWKTLSGTMLRNFKDVQISNNRVWRFSRKFLGEVEVQNAYSFGARRCSILKGDVSRLGNLRPKLLPTKSHVSEKKRDDVRRLLQFVPLTASARTFYDTELAKPCTKKAKDDVTENVLPLSGRGRAAAEQQPQTSKPKRGQPRKGTPALEETPQNVKKRGLAGLPSASEAPQVKRPRGRPRKL